MYLYYAFCKRQNARNVRNKHFQHQAFYDKVRLGLLPYYYFVAGNQLRVLLAILTNINITGTSTSTPTTVANAAPDCKPKEK